MPPIRLKPVDGVLTRLDPSPVSIMKAFGASPYVLTCDHAGHRLPITLGNLGLTWDEQHSHIAWDIGVAELAKRLAGALDAVLILQTYSRLVIDCNRPLGSAGSILVSSERTAVPGNRALSQADMQARARDIRPVPRLH